MGVFLQMGGETRCGGENGDPYNKAWHILGDRLIPEQLLWVDRGIFNVTH